MHYAWRVRSQPRHHLAIRIQTQACSGAPEASKALPGARGSYSGRTYSVVICICRGMSKIIKFFVVSDYVIGSTQ